MSHHASDTSRNCSSKEFVQMKTHDQQDDQDLVLANLKMAVPITPEFPVAETLDRLIAIYGQSNELSHLSTEEVLESIITQCRNCLVTG